MTKATDNIACTPCQDRALDALRGHRNVFLTGPAGTGKSHLIAQFLRGKGSRQYPVVAATGAAAIIVDGRTFHSFFGLGIMSGWAEEIVSNALRNQSVIRRLQQAECVIIDEVSMLSGETLYVASEVAKAARYSEEPWGGLRVIAVGDFAQLPPVTPAGAAKDWAFLHDVWRESDFETVYMQSVVRTEEEELLNVLHHIRSGIVNDDVRGFLNARLSSDAKRTFDGTKLFPHRRTADTYNQQRLDTLPKKEHVLETEYDGPDWAVERLRKNLPIPDTLRLKRDALVMIRRNDTQFPYRYINGTLGKVRGIDSESLWLELLDGEEIELQKQAFSLMDGAGEELATAWNFPVSLAWATTIHKAQGATIDRLMVNLKYLWESGHAYVALSRVRSAAGLFVESWSEQAIIVDEQVQDFYRSLV